MSARLTSRPPTLSFEAVVAYTTSLDAGFETVDVTVSATPLFDAVATFPALTLTSTTQITPFTAHDAVIPLLLLHSDNASVATLHRAFPSLTIEAAVTANAYLDATFAEFRVTMVRGASGATLTADIPAPTLEPPEVVAELRGLLPALEVDIALTGVSTSAEASVPPLSLETSATTASIAAFYTSLPVIEAITGRAPHLEATLLFPLSDIAGHITPRYAPIGALMDDFPILAISGQGELSVEVHALFPVILLAPPTT